MKGKKRAPRRFVDGRTARTAIALRIPLLVGIPVTLVLVSAAVALAATQLQGVAPGKDVEEYQPHPAYAVARSGSRSHSTAPATSHEAAALPPPPEGLIQSGQAPFPPTLYSFLNQWQGKLGGHWIQVYAGALVTDSSQGVLIVRTSALDWSSSDRPVILLAPVKDGSLRITAVNGNELTLQSLQGGRYRYEIDQGQLIRS